MIELAYEMIPVFIILSLLASMLIIPKIISYILGLDKHIFNERIEEKYDLSKDEFKEVIKLGEDYIKINSTKGHNDFMSIPGNKEKLDLFSKIQEDKSNYTWHNNITPYFILLPIVALITPGVLIILEKIKMHEPILFSQMGLHGAGIFVGGLLFLLFIGLMAGKSL